MKVDVGKAFHSRLTNRDASQGDGKHTAVQFRERYLKGLDREEAWSTNLDPFIELDFSNVAVIAPSFANEAFAHFTQYAEPEAILKRIVFVNISPVKMQIIEIELKAGRQIRQT